MLNAILELFPIAIAIAAIIVASDNYNNPSHHRRYSKLFAMLSIIGAAILIIAQSSWFVVSVLLHQLEDTRIINYIWTVFNTVSMVILVVGNLRNDHKI